MWEIGTNWSPLAIKSISTNQNKNLLKNKFTLDKKIFHFQEYMKKWGKNGFH